SLVRQGKSLVLDFGDFGTDEMVYLFVANVLARRFFDLYTEKNEEFPRLTVFLEEAHKFLDPDIANYTIFSKLARETRKFMKQKSLLLLQRLPNGSLFWLWRTSFSSRADIRSFEIPVTLPGR
ncbi:MAG: hypothetical protein ABFS39_13540, partial [Pseudomonadota bacterium]